MVTLRRVAIALLAFALCSNAHTQALATASGPGTYVAVGGALSGFQGDYGHQDIYGTAAYADVNPHWRVGLEGEARYLRWHTQEQVTESNYLVGLRLQLAPRPGRWEPYAKVLAGASRITLPYRYAHGTFFTYAPGAGLEFAWTDRLSVRIVDIEYQRWPQFTYGILSPYGISTGITLRLNEVTHYPKGARARK